MTISIEEIKADMLKVNETDMYYWDALNDNGYHMHLLTDGRVVCMKQENGHIERITEDKFINAVNNDCHLCSIGEDSFYDGLMYIF